MAITEVKTRNNELFRNYTLSLNSKNASAAVWNVLPNKIRSITSKTALKLNLENILLTNINWLFSYHICSGPLLKQCTTPLQNRFP